MSVESVRWKVVLEVDGLVRETVVDAATVWEAVVAAKGAETDAPRLLLVTSLDE